MHLNASIEGLFTELRERRWDLELMTLALSSSPIQQPNHAIHKLMFIAEQNKLNVVESVSSALRLWTILPRKPEYAKLF
jgi:hypothetical protein